MCTDLLALSFKKMAEKERLMMKTSLANGVKVHTLLCCSFLETCVLDGRDGKYKQTMLNIDIERGEIYETPIRRDALIDSKKVFRVMLSTCYCIIILGLIMSGN